MHALHIRSPHAPTNRSDPVKKPDQTGCQARLYTFRINSIRVTSGTPSDPAKERDFSRNEDKTKIIRPILSQG